MFRHMAILKFKPDAKQADIDAYFAAFPGLMASLPVIKAWNIGRTLPSKTSRNCLRCPYSNFSPRSFF